MQRILIVSTHPVSTNGYSNVVYNLIKQFGIYDKFDIVVYGFHKIENESRSTYLNDMKKRIIIHDVGKTFGFEDIDTFIRLSKPDIVFIYNDAYVVSQFLNCINNSESNFRIIVYFDQVYDFTKPYYIKCLNDKVDHVCVFSNCWKEALINDGLLIDCSVIEHGLSELVSENIQECSKNILGLDSQDFHILNLNRNQPRKRWDVTLMALAHLYKNYEIYDCRVKLIVGTSNEGAWNLKELLNEELKGTYICADDVLIFVSNPQALDDKTITMLYDAADIGLNTCDGEGFGLCNTEHAKCGKPQIIPRIGSFKDLFDDTCSKMCDPIASYYVDNTRDLIGGKASLIDYKDVADAMYQYYIDEDTRLKHGILSKIKLSKYTWDRCTQMFKKLFENNYS